MRVRHLIVLCAVILFAMPGVAGAQNREPHAGSFAIGGDAGFYVPDEEFHTGFTPAVLAEFYIGPRISVRALGGWSRNEFVSMSDRYLEQFRYAFNFVYNWECEYWHPFVTFGGGGHTVRTWRDDVEQTPWHFRGGLNIGAGIEYFVRPKVTFKFEGTYYYVNHPATPPESMGFAATVGMKRYF